MRAQTPILSSAVENHREWLAQVSALYTQAKAGKVAGAAVKARLLGEKYGALFRRLLTQANGLKPPNSAVRCQEYLIRWLDYLIKACDALLHAPEDGRDTTYLRDCHDFMDDARFAATALNDIRQRLYEVAKGETAAHPKPSTGTA